MIERGVGAGSTRCVDKVVLGQDDEVGAGDLFIVAGFPEVEIGDTLADPTSPVPLPMRMRRRNTCATLSMKKENVAATTTRPTDAARAIRISFASSSSPANRA